MGSTISLPAMSFDQHDRAVLDFVQTIKATEVSKRGALVRADYEERKQQWAAEHGRTPVSVADVADVMRDSVAWKFDRALWRFSQEMMYGRIREALLPEKDDLLAFLDVPVPAPLGSEELDPNLAMPAYYETDYHVQPGGMHRDRLVPFVTKVSNDVFSGGRSKNFEFQAQAVAAIPAGNWGRIVDLGAGFKSAIVIKQRFPESEVYGIDLSGPLVKFGHRLAEAMGLAIHMSQQNAEHTNFPDGFFDVVFSTLLFHEIPDAAARNVICESYRILKPGGWFVMDDTPTYDRLDPFAAFESDWNTANNVEPYWTAACNRDYPALLREAGFHDIEVSAVLPGRPLRITRARK